QQEVMRQELARSRDDSSALSKQLEYSQRQLEEAMARIAYYGRQSSMPRNVRPYLIRASLTKRELIDSGDTTPDGTRLVFRLRVTPEVELARGRARVAAIELHGSEKDSALTFSAISGEIVEDQLRVSIITMDPNQIIKRVEQNPIQLDIRLEVE